MALINVKLSMATLPRWTGKTCSIRANCSRVYCMPMTTTP